MVLAGLITVGLVLSLPKTRASESASVASATEGLYGSTVASASAPAPASQSASMVVGVPTTTGTHSGTPRQGDVGDSRVATQPATPVTPAKDTTTVSPNAVSHLAGASIVVPQTYLCTVRMLGWQQESAGLACVQVTDARLLGPVDPSTGDEREAPTASEKSYASRLRGISLLAMATERARSGLSEGRTTDVNLVLLPSEGGPTFIIDRVFD